MLLAAGVTGAAEVDSHGVFGRGALAMAIAAGVDPSDAWRALAIEGEADQEFGMRPG